MRCHGQIVARREGRFDRGWDRLGVVTSSAAWSRIKNWSRLSRSRCPVTSAGGAGGQPTHQSQFASVFEVVSIQAGWLLINQGQLAQPHVAVPGLADRTGYPKQCFQRDKQVNGPGDMPI